MAGDDTKDNVTLNTASVTVKLPEFWPKEPEIWFIQAESQFALRKVVTEDTKYHHVVQALDQETAAKVKPVLLSPDKATPYSVEKENIGSVYRRQIYSKAFTFTPTR